MRCGGIYIDADWWWLIPPGNLFVFVASTTNGNQINKASTHGCHISVYILRLQHYLKLSSYSGGTIFAFGSVFSKVRQFDVRFGMKAQKDRSPKIGLAYVRFDFGRNFVRSSGFLRMLGGLMFVFWSMAQSSGGSKSGGLWRTLEQYGVRLSLIHI